MEDYEAWWTYATRNTIRFSESAAAEQPEEPESAAAAGAQPGGTAQSGTVDQLPDPLTMSRISMGLRIAFMDYYRGESLPDFFGGFYDNADGTVVMCLTDTSEAVLEEIRTAFYSYHDGRNPEHFDKWLPTVQITEVKYSFEQLVEVDRALRSALAEADCGEYITPHSLPWAAPAGCPPAGHTWLPAPAPHPFHRKQPPGCFQSRSA